MTLQEIDDWLARSLDDRRFSRGERQALSEFLATLKSAAERDTVRRRAFEVARASLTRPEDGPALDWLEEVTRVVREVGQSTRPVLAEAYFSPGEDCPRAIARLLTTSSKSADICVFTITDDRLAEAILDAHRRGVAVRIISDDAKAEDEGSDVGRFEQSGIPTRVDRSPYHMHHKFAILDGETLLTGSYNWTRGAARDNEENLIVTTDPRLVSSFEGTFARLWAKLASPR
jgi:phosphatidylserine/phosphatidylglycerophosphate/cardiolipin synthase-like enzyme